MGKRKIIKQLIEKRETIVNAVVMLLIFAYLVSYFKPELILSTTTTSGGDMGSHNYLAKFMKENLAKGEIVGWSNDWYAGLPMFQYYFPLAYIMMAFLSIFVNVNIAFKIITVFGTFITPLCAYVAFRIFRFRFPVPAIAAVFTLPFLFLQSNSMYGGNIPSTLAGEFSFSISMALSIIFIASLFNGIKTKKMLAFNIVLLGIIALLHIIPIIPIALSSLFFLRNNTKKNLKYLTCVYIGAFLLTGFWSIPLISKFGYATSNSFTAIHDIKDILPDGFSYIFLFTGLGLVYAFKKKDERIIYLGIISFVSFLLFAFMPTGFIWNTRFLPWYYMTSVLMAAYGLNEIIGKIKLKILIPVFIFISVVLLLNNYVTYIGGWISWNYSGFENKPQWSTFNQMNAFLNSLPYGKVLHEYSEKHNSMFGTPRAFELIPYFTNKPGMEGLLIESSASSPFYFYLQSEMSETPTCPISTFRCTSFNIDDAMKKMELFNIKYVVATSEKLKSALENNTKVALLKKIDDIWIYEVKRENAYVSPLMYMPVVAERTKWHEFSSDWIRSEFSDVTIIYDTSLPYQKIGSISEIEKKPIEYCNVSEKLNGQDEIFITTNCIGKPLLVKVTYSPNWQADGANIYMASPSFFVIIPQKNNVRLYYGNTWSEWLGMVATLVMISILLNIRFKWFNV